MKFIKIIGLFCLFCVTFIYTEEVITVSMDQDKIMIKIKILKDYIEVKGHANYDDFGKDIVCASVSSIVITTVNAIVMTVSAA